MILGLFWNGLGREEGQGPLSLHVKLCQGLDSSLERAQGFMRLPVVPYPPKYKEQFFRNCFLEGGTSRDFREALEL